MSTIKSSSEDLTLNADGSNDIKFQSNGVEKASISSAGAFTSTTIDATKLTGEKRNFIIDGDFTQWPEGTSQAALANGQYGPALWKLINSGGEAVFTVARDTDVPTLAESSHQSKYSMKMTATTAETAYASTEFSSLVYHITGTDFTTLHGQEITVAFWIKYDATGTASCSLRNGNAGGTIAYAFDFAVVANTWTYVTKTLTMSTDSTWLFTDADIGMYMYFTMGVGSSRHVTTDDAWNEETLTLATSTQTNFAETTNADMWVSQVGLYLGSVAPTFTSPPIATVKDQVDWYVQRFDYDTVGAETIAIGHCFSTGQNYCHFNYRKKMRIAPSGSSTASATFETSNAAGAGENISAGPTFSGVGKNACRFYMQKTTSDLVAGDASMFHRDGSDTCWLMLDARH